MNISINVDLTPEELRRFLGLPDIKPLQDEMVEKMREQLSAGAEGLDPAGVMAPMMATNMAAYEAMQKAFWSALAGAGDGTKEVKEAREGKSGGSRSG